MMAGIDRICEFAGGSNDFEMSLAKRNHIQIAPQHRKKFRGAKAELVFTVAELEQCQRIRKTTYSQTLAYHEAVAYYEGDVRAWWKDAVEYGGFFHRVEYTFELRVEDPELLGRVNGVYRNLSTNKSAVIRRMKRLIGKNLVIRDEVGLTKKQLIKQWEKDLTEKARSLIKQKASA